VALRHDSSDTNVGQRLLKSRILKRIRRNLSENSYVALFTFARAVSGASLVVKGH